MSRWIKIAFGGAAVVAGAFALSRRREKRVPDRVALIGDSYASGLGPELAKLIPNFKYEGHVGTTTGQWANHMPQCGQCGDWLTAFKPQLVLVSLGVNDGTTPNIENYHRILQGLYGIGAHVAWISAPEGVNTQSRNTIASVGVTRIAPTRTPLAADGLHPQRYDRWAQEIANAISV